MDSKQESQTPSQKNKKIYAFYILLLVVILIIYINQDYLVGFMKNNTKNENRLDHAIEKDQNSFEFNSSNLFENNENIISSYDNNLLKTHSLDNNEAVELDIDTKDNKNAYDNNNNAKINLENYIKLINSYESLVTKISNSKDIGQELYQLNLLLEKDLKAKNFIGEISNYYNRNNYSMKDLFMEFKFLERKLIFSDFEESKSNIIMIKIYKLLNKFIYIKKIGNRALKSNDISANIQRIYDAFEASDIELLLNEVNRIYDQKLPHEVQKWIRSVKNFYIISNSLQSLGVHIKKESFYMNFIKIKSIK